MSTRSWQIRIEDILDAIVAIESYVAGMDEVQWRDDRKTIDAVVRNLEIIGEAAGQVPVEIQGQYSEIPWGKMKAMRNVLTHEYFGVDIEVLWRTVQEDLPPLQAALARIPLTR